MGYTRAVGQDLGMEKGSVKGCSPGPTAVLNRGSMSCESTANLDSAGVHIHLP